MPCEQIYDLGPQILLHRLYRMIEFHVENDVQPVYEIVEIFWQPHFCVLLYKTRNNSYAGQQKSHSIFFCQLIAHERDPISHYI